MKSFGEKVEGFDVRVLNEREVRAAAGIMLIGALLTFLDAVYSNNFLLLKIYITFFLADFSTRLFVGPAFSPSLILARVLVKNQNVEYSGAPQKRFAWFLGFAMALVMFILLPVLDTRSWAPYVACTVCITLLFLETSFGICVGCKVYNIIFKEKAKLCPGGACSVEDRVELQRVSTSQVAILAFSLVVIASLVFYLVPLS